VPADGGVTLTGRRFEFSPFEYAHSTIATGDQSALLERVEHDRDGGTAHPEHHREELVLQRKVVGVDTVVSIHEAARAHTFIRPQTALPGRPDH